MKIKNKKAIVFSIVTLVISIIVLSISYLLLDEKVYSKDNDYFLSRIKFVDSDLKYFKNTFSKEIIRFSTYNCLKEYIEYYKIYPNSNYSLFVNDLKSCIINATTYNGTLFNNLENRTITYFFDDYFNYSLIHNNIEYNLTIFNITFYEEEPYTLTINFSYNLKVFPKEEICRWNFNDSEIIKLNLYELKDPFFYYRSNPNSIFPLLRSSEYYSSLSNAQTPDKFNETISKNYFFSSLFLDTDYRIGKSFVMRLLNLSYKKFDRTLAFYSFDRDIEFSDSLRDLYFINENYVTDDRLLSFGNLFGITKMAITFENNTLRNVTGNSYFVDKSSYKNDLYLYANYTRENCLVDECVNFNGSNEYLINKNLNLNLSEPFSVSVWIRPKNVTQNENATIFILSKTGKDGFGLKYRDQSDSLIFFVGNGSDFDEIEIGGIENNSWNHIICVYNLTNIIAYRNGILSEVKEVSVNNITKLTNNISFGAWKEMNKWFYNGQIDEINVYQKGLTYDEVIRIYNKKKIDFLEYLETRYGKGVYLDGKDDFIDISFNDSFSVFPKNNFSIMMLFIPKTRVFNLLTFNNSLEVGYNGSEILFKDNKGHPNRGIEYNLTENKEYFLVLVRNASNSMNYFYMNGELLGNISSINWGADGSKDVFTIGSGNYPNNGSTGKFFNGVIDELVIYNKTLSKSEIKSFYLNYDGFVKGKANYLGLINPNQMGFNSPIYKFNVSYSDLMFYDYLRTRVFKNITLDKVNNITSDIPSEEYYNFLFDTCLTWIFRAATWVNGSSYRLVNVNLGVDDNCHKLQFYGYY